jgi:hypothetical protein
MWLATAWQRSAHQATRGQRALAIEHKPKYYHGEARQGEWKDGQNILHQRSFPIARLASNTQTCVTRAG